MPKTNLAVSYLLNDKFPYVPRDLLKKQNRGYAYLGIRQAANVAYTNSINIQILNSLIYMDANKKETICRIFDFLGLDNKYSIFFIRKKKKQIPELKTFIEKAVNTAKDNIEKKTMGRPNHRDERLCKIRNDDINKMIEIITGAHGIDYVGRKAYGTSYDFMLNKSTSDSALETDYKYFQMITDLRLSDLYLVLYKSGIPYRFEDGSSGKKQVLFTFINLLFHIEPNSIVAIDEPEISLHPNWQMKYIGCLKEVFAKYASCHFLLATHSHYIISDLEKTPSSLVVLKKHIEDSEIVLTSNLLGCSTYAWSAENILYNVFEVRTTRNFYFEAELRNLIYDVQNRAIDRRKETIGLYNKLLSYVMDKNDPLNKILSAMESYIDEIEKIDQ